MLLPHFHRQIRALPWLVLGMSVGIDLAYAQKQNEPSLLLRSSSLLQEVITPDARKQLPTFLESNSLNENANQLTTLEGQVALRRGEIFIKADKVDYDQAEDLAKARGNVYINRAGNVYQGPALDLQLDAFEGFFTQPSYRLLKNNVYGDASRIDFVDPSHTVMHTQALPPVSANQAPTGCLIGSSVPTKFQRTQTATSAWLKVVPCDSRGCLCCPSQKLISRWTMSANQVCCHPVLALTTLAVWSIPSPITGTWHPTATSPSRPPTGANAASNLTPNCAT
jgi:hypothetical protein